MIPFAVRHRRLLVQSLLALGIAVIVVSAAMLWSTWWGDPSIYLPYARNIAAGDFFSYNSGTFSSGSTSPLWAVLLAIPYALGAGVTGAKILALLVTLAAFAATALAATNVAGRAAGAVLASLYVVEMMTVYGVLIYESSLIVLLVALSIVLGLRVMQVWHSDRRLDVRMLAALALVWAAMPLTRPDAVVLVVLQFLAFIIGGVRRPRAVMGLLLVAALAAIPSALYFGYSWITLGTISVSSQNRAFALREMATHAGPLFLSKDSIAYVGSILYALVVAAIGLDLMRQDGGRRWLVVEAIGALILYPVLLTFVSPVTNDLPRYFLPTAPFVVVAVGRALTRWEALPGRRWAVALLLLVGLFAVKPAVAVLGTSLEQATRGYRFDEIMEKGVVEEINRIAEPNATVLAYEVQDRYFLRHDLRLLSLDGITDGRVTPFLVTGDIAAFLRAERPEYWIANDAVNYRPFLKHGILSRATEVFADTSRTTALIDGVQFTLLDRRTAPMPRGFAGWTRLFRLEYPGVVAR